MKKPQDIILKPIITERSMTGIGEKKYTFQVAKDANKIEIAEAVKALFGVDVVKVNTVSCKGQAQKNGPLRRLQTRLEESDCYLKRIFQGHRVLRGHDLNHLLRVMYGGKFPSLNQIGE